MYTYNHKVLLFLSRRASFDCRGESVCKKIQNDQENIEKSNIDSIWINRKFEILHLTVSRIQKPISDKRLPLKMFQLGDKIKWWIEAMSRVKWCYILTKKMQAHTMQIRTSILAQSCLFTLKLFFIHIPKMRYEEELLCDKTKNRKIAWSCVITFSLNYMTMSHWQTLYLL